MEILEFLDNDTLKLVDCVSSFTFYDFYTEYKFDRDYNVFYMNNLRSAITLWRTEKEYCIKKYGHITFWDTSFMNNKSIYVKGINEILLWKNLKKKL